MDRNVSLCLKQQKKELRERYRAIRKNIAQNYSNYAAKLLVNLFNQNLSDIKGKAVAAYIPMDGELNVVPLMNNLLNLRYRIAVPISLDHMIFEEWGKIGESMVPDTIITPVIAFDDKLNRLGFGSGWYDRVIEKLRPIGKIFIGVAYEKQYCKDLPVEKHDQKLDMIITETCVRRSSESIINS